MDCADSWDRSCFFLSASFTVWVLDLKSCGGTAVVYTSIDRLEAERRSTERGGNWRIASLPTDSSFIQLRIDNLGVSLSVALASLFVFSFSAGLALETFQLFIYFFPLFSFFFRRMRKADNWRLSPPFNSSLRIHQHLFSLLTRSLLNENDIINPGWVMEKPFLVFYFIYWFFFFFFFLT